MYKIWNRFLFLQKMFQIT